MTLPLNDNLGREMTVLINIFTESMKRYQEAASMNGIELEAANNPYSQFIDLLPTLSTPIDMINNLVVTELSQGPENFQAIETPFIVYALLIAEEQEQLKLFKDILPENKTHRDKLLTALRNYILQMNQTEEDTLESNHFSDPTLKLNRNENLAALLDLLDLLKTYERNLVSHPPSNTPSTH